KGDDRDDHRPRRSDAGPCRVQQDSLAERSTLSRHGDPCSMLGSLRRWPRSPVNHDRVENRDVAPGALGAGSMSAPAVRTRTVSVLLPTLNERGFIRDCLESLVHQQGCEIDEILVLDGGSTDGTRDIVDAMGPPVRLVPNPGVTAAAAMNLGVA